MGGGRRLDVTEIQQCTDVCTEHGEGPFWDFTRGRLLVLDMLAGAIVEVAHDGLTERHERGGVVATIRARRRGGYVIATERGFLLLDKDFEPDGEEVVAFDDPGIRMNDGGCDPQGRFYCGTMAYAQTPGAGSLHRLDPDMSTQLVFGGVTISNGLQWHADGRRAYYNDTPTGVVAVMDFDPVTGSFGTRRQFAAVAGPGKPDGMAVDDAGGVWVALWGGGAVHRYDAAGVLTDQIRLPVRQVSACTFGDADLSTLYVTTSRLDLGDDAEPSAGAVFAARVPYRGRAPYSFAG
jgi:sugar lactone lactonase YvrE